MTPVQLEILLDSAVADGFHRHDGASAGPKFLSPEAGDISRISVVLETGERRERLFPEDVPWWQVRAFRLEDSFGNTVDPLDPDGDFEDWE